MQFAVTFAIVMCECGAERQAGVQCSTCGRGADEADPLVAARMRVRELACAEAPAKADREPLELDEVFGLLGAWTDRFMETTENVAKQLDDEPDEANQEALGRELQGPVAELGELAARAASTRRLRPAVRVWRIVDRLLAMLHDMRENYLDALTAPTPAEATAKAEEGQAALDRASTALGHFNRFTDVWDAIEQARLDEFSDVLEGATAISRLQESGDIVELDRRGRELAQRITGKPVDFPQGMGLVLLHVDMAAEASYDTDRFWSGAGEVYRLAVAHPAALMGLFQEEDWRQEIAILGVDVRDAAFELLAVAEASSNRRRQIKSALGVGAHFFERAAPPLLATLLCVQRRSAYAHERRKEAFALVREVEQAGLAHLLTGLDPKIRDADAHGQFEVTDDAVIFTGTRGTLTSATDAELVDLILAGLESISMFYWGVITALVEAGADPLELEQVVSPEIAPADQVRYLLRASGWQNVEVEIDNGHLEARGERDEPSRLGLIAALVPILPAEVETARLTRVGEDGDHVAEGPLAPFREWSDEEDEQLKENVFTRASLLWTIDGTAVLNETQVRKIAAFRALVALDRDSVGARLTSLRGLLDHARAVDDQELSHAVSLAMSAVRNQDHAELARAVNQLAEWAAEPIADPVEAW